MRNASDDPAFSIKNDCNIGDRIQAMVIDAENENGVVILSKKAAHNLMIWDELEEDYQNRTVFQVKITDTTSGGIIGYVKRGTCVYSSFQDRAELRRRYLWLFGNDIGGNDHYCG